MHTLRNLKLIRRKNNVISFFFLANVEIIVQVKYSNSQIQIFIKDYFY